MPNRSEYQPLAQSVEDEETDVSEGILPQPARGLRRAQRPVHIDLSKLDNAFKRCAVHCAHSYVREPSVFVKVDGVHRPESQAKEEGRGQLQEGDMAQRIRAPIHPQHRTFRACEYPCMPYLLSFVS